MTETTSAMAPLFDVLTTLIAFSVIMLLLSLVVTTLVQGAQSAFALRARNLRRGLADLLDAVTSDDGDGGATNEEGAARREGVGTDRKPAAEDVVEHPLVNLGKGRFWQRRGTTWITKEELDRILTGLEGLTEKGREQAMAWFDRFEANLSKRFLAQIRWVTFGCALAVAVLFQVDAVRTLAELSADAEARERIAAAAEPLLERTEEDLRELGDPRATFGEALAELEGRFPEEEERIEEVSGEVGARAEVVDEIRRVLGPGERTEEIVDAFEGIVDERFAERSRRATAARENALATASRLGIEPWPDGLGFYFDGLRPRVKRWIGVLLTALLLSLGAPFWFNQLQSLVNLRDRLAELAKKPAA